MTEQQRASLTRTLGDLRQVLLPCLPKTPVFLMPFRSVYEQLGKRSIDSVCEALQTLVIQRFEAVEFLLKLEGYDEVVRERKVDELIFCLELLVRSNDLLVDVVFCDFGRPQKCSSQMSSRFFFLRDACTPGFRSLGNPCVQRCCTGPDERSGQAGQCRDKSCIHTISPSELSGCGDSSIGEGRRRGRSPRRFRRKSYAGLQKHDGR